MRHDIERVNASGLTPVVFVHGLWLLPASWDRWMTLFEEAGYVGLTPGWPDDPSTTADAKADPAVFAGKGVGDVADYQEAIIRRLDKKPAVPVAGRPGLSPALHVIGRAFGRSRRSGMINE